MPQIYSDTLAGLVRAFWDSAASWAQVVGFGLALAFGALWNAGTVPWVVAVIMIVGSLLLALFSTAWRRKYLKYIRPRE